MALPGTMGGTVGRFASDDVTLDSYANTGNGVARRVLDLGGGQTDLAGGVVLTGRAACEVEVNRADVRIDGTDVDIGSAKELDTFATPFACMGRTVAADTTLAEGSGVFPFSLLSAVANVRCERLHFDTDAMREAWAEDGTLSDTWLAASSGNGSAGTVMAYGDASDPGKASDIGLGFERAWQGFMLRGVVYESGYLAVYEDLGTTAFLRFIDEELVPFGFVPEDDDAEQTTLAETETDAGTCTRCGRESDDLADGLCVVCRDHEADEFTDYNGGDP